jgi:hypothetical protein
MANSEPTLPLAPGISAVHIIVQTNRNELKSLVPILADSDHHLNTLEAFFQRLGVGVWRSNTYVSVNPTYASDLVTFSSLANNDTVTVNGRVYTAKTSGATGLQQFNLGASDTAAAANFATVLNADTSTAVEEVVMGVATGATITLYSMVPGNIGLQLTASISAHGTVATANFTGGTEGTNADGGHGL